MLGPDDLTLLQEVARRTATALENSELYRAAQEAVRLRDEFISIASHELRTPLTPLKLSLQSIQRTVAQRPDGGKKQPQQLIQKVDLTLRQVDRLSRLIADLLDVSRISSGRLRLELEPFDLAARVREVVERFADEALRQGCRLEVHADRPVYGRWDAGRIEQVLVNLLTNAMKYGAGSPIEIALDPPDDGAEVRLRVTDQGIGIAPEHQQRIFERFERAVSSNEYGGLGLGLYITREIVHAHGGAVRVYSDGRRGSTFEVQLPRNSTFAAPSLHLPTVAETPVCEPGVHHA